jgi:DNA modification methylase
MMATTLLNETVTAGLQQVDWNFPRSTTLRDSIHSLHWFPGNFIPDIPGYLVQLLSTKDMLVADPFCGSGTTGVEAFRLGRRAWMSDVNRAALLIAAGKLAIFKNGNITGELIKFAMSISRELPFRSLCQPLEEIGTDLELSGWFHADTLSQLQSIWTQIESVGCAETRAALTMVFSDTLFACASTLHSKTSTGGTRRHHWGWIADNVKPDPPVWHNAERIFRERLNKAIEISSRIDRPLAAVPLVQFEDCRSLSLGSDSVDLVVTSPPYLGMIDYARANRLSYLWFGWPMKEDCDREIGSRYRRNNQGEPLRYVRYMQECCVQIHRVLKREAICAIVIGASRRFPGMALQVIDMFGASMQRIWGPTPRTPERRRVSERLGSEPSEYICVFRKL